MGTASLRTNFKMLLSAHFDLFLRMTKQERLNGVKYLVNQYEPQHGLVWKRHSKLIQHGR